MGVDPKDIFVLVACEESQEVCKSFRERGFTAFSCDLQCCSGGHPEWHILGNVIPILNGQCFVTTLDDVGHWIDHWDLLIAHPPCTYLSSAGACRLFNKNHSIKDYNRLEEVKKAARFFEIFLGCGIQYIAIENPTPLHISGLPSPTQVIQPFNFGEEYSKRTCLWLDGLPPLMNTFINTNHSPFVGNSKYIGKAAHRSKDRSKTFPLIAKAMAEQWGDYILNVESDWESFRKIVLEL